MMVSQSPHERWVPARFIAFLSPQGAALAKVFCACVVSSLVLTAASPAKAQTYEFRTVAGGFLGDDQPAVNAGLSTPAGIAFDAAGNLYIAQIMENRIRKVTPAGVISSFAGTSEYGFGGDGGQAKNAVFRNPLGLVVDGSGNVYFSDSLNYRVRKITTAGVISTVAGNGSAVSSGDGGSAKNAGLRRPYGLTFDNAGNLYIAESLGHRVRKVTPAGIISTVAGTGTLGYSGDDGPATAAALYEPTGVAFDAAQNLYITDSKNSVVRRVSPGGAISTVASGITLPYGIAAGPDGHIYVSDSDCYIRRLDGGGSMIIAGKGPGLSGVCGTSGDGGPAIDADIDLPEGIAFDAAGDLYFADSSSYRVRRISGGIINTVVGHGSFFGDGGPAIAATLSTAQGLAVGADGSLFIADSYPNGRIRKVNPAGIVQTVAGNGGFASSGDGGAAIEASLYYPRGVTLDATGNLYITERIGGSVRKVGSGIISTITDGLWRPNRTAIDRLGNIYITDTMRNVVKKLSPGGAITIFAGQEVPVYYPPNYGDGGPATSARLASPSGIAIDPAGNVYIADSGFLRIRKVNPAGIISTVAGSSTMTDFGPIPKTYGGDGGLAIHAGLSYPTGLALDPYGNLYIAGAELRKVTPAGTISTIRGMTHQAYDVASDRSGAVYVATLGGRVLKGVRGRTVDSDFNGDGFSDMFWRNAADGRNAYWGTASSAIVSNQPIVADPKWTVAGSGDFNADGRADILWNNGTTGESVIWFSGSGTTYQTLTRLPDTNYRIVGIGDFDGDGKADILWRHSLTRAVAIWRGGNSTDRPPVVIVTDPNWRVAGVGDFDGDGKSDILWRHMASGANAIWKSGNSTTAQSLSTLSDMNWRVVGTGDFNRDGKSDIVWYHANGSSGLWKSGNSTQTQGFARVLDTGWQIIGVGDYNGDGDSDLLWHHATGKNAIWKSGNSGTLQTITTVTDANWKIVD